MNSNVLLIVEDDPDLCRQYKGAFADCDVVVAPTHHEAVKATKRQKPHVAVIDLGSPADAVGRPEGWTTLEQILQLSPQTKIIVATGNGGKESALLAISKGAHDFYEKPIDIEVLKIIIKQSFRVLEAENNSAVQNSNRNPIKSLVTNSEVMLRVCKNIERLSHTNIPVLLLGESGTGKEVLARALHELGPRASGPFVGINCGAISEFLLESELFGYERGAFTGAVKQTVGRIETAQNGTLFLDEIGELPLHLQVKLLRFLQERIIERVGGRRSIPVDVRIVSATNRQLESLVREGKFREDLFYRLNAVSIRVPPLRERTGDSILLARYFLDRFGKDARRRFVGFTDQAVEAVVNYSWPGNVRELENRVRRAVIMGEQNLVGVDDLELSVEKNPEFDLRTARRKAERDLIELALAHSDGSIARAARLLQVSRPTLYSLMDALGIKSSGDRRRAR
jgi:two-component system NtrC family response regulator